MTNVIVPKRRSGIKGDIAYQTAHESLNAKLNQANAIANMATAGNPTESQLFHVVWCLSDLLRLACDECEQLRPEDIP